MSTWSIGDSTEPVPLPSFINQHVAWILNKSDYYVSSSEEVPQTSLNVSKKIWGGVLIVDLLCAFPFVKKFLFCLQASTMNNEEGTFFNYDKGCSPSQCPTETLSLRKSKLFRR